MAQFVGKAKEMQGLIRRVEETNDERQKKKRFGQDSEKSLSGRVKCSEFRSAKDGFFGLIFSDRHGGLICAFWKVGGQSFMRE